MPVSFLLRWPLLALLVWAASWMVFLLIGGHAPLWLCLLCSGLVGTLASLWGGSWWRRLMMAGGFPLSLAVLYANSMPAWGWLVPLGLLLLVYPLNAWRDAPVFPSPPGALDALGQQLGLPAQAQMLDAGCGAGDGLKALRRAWPHAACSGIEWSWPLVAISALRCPWAQVRRGDIWDADWSGYQLVYLFQRPESMSRVILKSLADMPDGAWLVSLCFPLPDVSPTLETSTPDGRPVYAYQTPVVSVEPTLSNSDAQIPAQSLYPRQSRAAQRSPRR